LLIWHSNYHIDKNTLLQTAFSAIFPLGKVVDKDFEYLVFEQNNIITLSATPLP